MLAEQIGDGAAAIVGPPQNGRVRERNHAHHQERRAQIRDLREGKACKLSAREDGRVVQDLILNARIREHRRNEHNAGECADDHGRPERARYRDERLLSRILRLRCRRDDRC